MAFGLVLSSVATSVVAQPTAELPVPSADRTRPPDLGYIGEGDWRTLRFLDDRVSVAMPCSDNEVSRVSPDDGIGVIYECNKNGLTFGMMVRRYEAGDAEASFDAVLVKARTLAKDEFINLVEEYSWFGRRAFRLICEKDVCDADEDRILVAYVDLAPGELLVVSADESNLPRDLQPQGRGYSRRFYDSLELAT